MKIVHRLGDRAVKKEGEGYFLLTDKAGSYLSLGSLQNISHMQGLFHLDKNWNMYKSLDNIYLDGELTELENNFTHVVRRYHDSEEILTLSSTALIYEVKNYSGNINIDIDFREMFDFDEHNRIYSINKSKDIIIIHYEKHKKYLVIKGVDEFEEVGQWEHRHYPYDKLRDTKSDFHIYKALRVKCEKNKKLFISFAETKKEALENVESASMNESNIKRAITLKSKNACSGTNLTINAATHSLDSLRNIIGKGGAKLEGVFAGLPWFFQFYARDELISLKAFMIEGRFDFVKKRLLMYLDAIDETGRVPNRLPSSSINSADATGWLFKRLYDLLTILEEKKALKTYFSNEELMKIKHKIHFSIEEHMVRYMDDNIIYNDAKETWMDTWMDDNDGRSGACIEIQALFLVYFKLLKVLCKELKLTYYGYSLLEKMFVKRVKYEFFKNNNLNDRIGDPTIRPNIFIAYYVYPELLTKKEWTMVFNKALRALWLEWGGLSSIDQNHAWFKPNYTGENNRSYHQGDSWYWVNNLAAVCLADLDQKRYHQFIDKIFHGNTEELLYQGFIGHCAEVSSASERKSEGCMSQAWSAATFIELAEKLKQL